MVDTFDIYAEFWAGAAANMDDAERIIEEISAALRSRHPDLEIQPESAEVLARVMALVAHAEPSPVLGPEYRGEHEQPGHQLAAMLCQIQGCAYLAGLFGIQDQVRELDDKFREHFQKLFLEKRAAAST